MTNPIIGCGWRFPPQMDARGMIALATDVEEIEQAIHIILGTIPGQRVMRPEFGCRIHELVFAPNNTATVGLAIRYITEALGRWEPRIHVQQVTADTDVDDPACLILTVGYEIAASHNRRSLVYPFYLIPTETSPTI
jgi:uncharacterized protein